jgi:hypothetical protein
MEGETLRRIGQKRLTFDVSPSFKARVQLARQQAETTISEYLRNAVRRQLERDGVPSVASSPTSRQQKQA